ncbi:MAG: hypothetical protein ACLQUY_02225 [Ktedonobacterales bacterium]
MNDPKKIWSRWTATKGIGGDLDGERELRLLALLERLQADRAQGLTCDLSVYCLADPELEDIFLEIALAADSAEDPVETGTAALQPQPQTLTQLSPGVLRALTRVPEFHVEAMETSDVPPTRRKVAESPAPYDPKTDGK